jgi:hypothetical protein
MQVRVRTLLTGVEALVELPETATVSDLRAALRRREEFPGRGALALFVGGRRLGDGRARVADALGGSSPNAFVVSVGVVRAAAWALSAHTASC